MADSDSPIIISDPEEEQIVPHSPEIDEFQPLTVPVTLPSSEDDPSEESEPMEEEEESTEENFTEENDDDRDDSTQHIEDHEDGTNGQDEAEEAHEEEMEPTDDPMPPPSHRTFRRTPDGVLMKITPRKSVLRLGKKRTSSPDPPVAKIPRVTPPWMAQIQEWGKEDDVHSQFEIGESSRAVPPPQEDSPAEAAIPVIMARITRLSQQVRTISDELGTVERNASSLANRVQSLEEERNLDKEAIQTLQYHHDIMQGQVTNQEMRIIELEYEMLIAEERVIAAETRATLAEQKVDSLYQQLTNLVFTLGSFCGLW